MKTITTNARGGNAVSILHLFTFELDNLDGTDNETLYFTDHDIFVKDGTTMYTPLSISFDKLSEDISMQSDSVSVTLDNINAALSEAALNYEWRKNQATVTRVIFTPNSETIDGDVYDFGYGDNLDTFPQLILQDIDSRDTYSLFSGYIESFSATQQSLTGKISTKFVHWSNPYPKRTFNQKEFTEVIDAISNTVYWGRTEP